MAQRKIRRVSPLGMRVVVKLEKDADVTESGLYLPEGSKDALKESVLAEVIEVASAHDTFHDEETNISGIPLGARVLLQKTAGTKLPWDDTCRIVDVKDILAVVDEVSLV